MKIKKIEKWLKTNRISCSKYNYCIEQRRDMYDSQLQISGDGERLMIINKVPIENHKYILEADPNQMELLKLECNIIDL